MKSFDRLIRQTFFFNFKLVNSGSQDPSKEMLKPGEIS